MSKAKSIKIEYFALLRQERGLSLEELDTEAINLSDLYSELQKKHRFSIPMQMLKAAVNDEFAPWNQKINEGDSIVFIPPVAGG